MDNRIYRFKITLHEFNEELDAIFETPFCLSDKAKFVFLSKELEVIEFMVKNTLVVNFCLDSKSVTHPTFFHPLLVNADKLNIFSADAKFNGFITRDMTDPFDMQVKATLEIISINKQGLASSSAEVRDSEIAAMNEEITMARGFKR